MVDMDALSDLFDRANSAIEDAQRLTARAKRAAARPEPSPRPASRRTRARCRAQAMPPQPPRGIGPSSGVCGQNAEPPRNTHLARATTPSVAAAQRTWLTSAVRSLK